jgi:hypothetical protein
MSKVMPRTILASLAVAGIVASTAYVSHNASSPASDRNSQSAQPMQAEPTDGGTELPWPSGHSPADSQLPEEKRELLAELQGNISAYLTRMQDDPAFNAEVLANKKSERTKHENSEPSEPPRPIQTDWPQGIFQDGEAPVSSMDLVATSRWVGLIDGVSVAVYVGADGQNPKDGKVFILRGDLGKPSGFVSRPDVGPLSVVSADGSVVVLQTSNGAQLKFDAAKGVFVE